MLYIPVYMVYMVIAQLNSERLRLLYCKHIEKITYSNGMWEIAASTEGSCKQRPLLNEQRELKWYKYPNLKKRNMLLLK